VGVSEGIINIIGQKIKKKLKDNDLHKKTVAVVANLLSIKWYLHRRENITCCRYRQPWRFEKMGEFVLKSHCSLDPHRVCERTLKESMRHSLLFFFLH